MLFRSSAWVKLTGDGEKIINNEPISESNGDWSIGQNYYRYYQANNDYTDLTFTNIKDGTWHHLIITHEGTTARAYIDGELNNERTDMYAYTQTNNQPIRIGSQAYKSIIGSIDELRIYNQTLTNNQVKRIHQASPYSENCGDDETLDDFYNGTIGTTKHFCQDGGYFNEWIDDNQNICTHYNYEWINTYEGGDYNHPSQYLLSLNPDNNGGFVLTEDQLINGHNNATKLVNSDTYDNIDWINQEFTTTSSSIVYLSTYFNVESCTDSYTLSLIKDADNYAMILLQNNGEVRHDYVIGGVNANGYDVAEYEFSEWHHAVYSLNFDTNEMTLYLDGEQVHTEDWSAYGDFSTGDY